jgi:hypothetical protein
LEPTLFASIRTLSIGFEDLNLLQQIKNCQLADEEVTNVQRYLLAQAPSPTKTALQKLWSVQDGLTFYDG